MFSAKKPPKSPAKAPVIAAEETQSGVITTSMQERSVTRTQRRTSLQQVGFLSVVPEENAAALEENAAVRPQSR